MRPALALGLLALAAACDGAGSDGDAGIAGDGFGDGGPPQACSACAAACQVMVSRQDSPGFYLLAADANGLVWSSGLAPVHFFARGPGASLPMLLASESAIDGALADDTTIYWMAAGAGGDHLRSVARAGGLPVTLLTTQQPNLQGVFTADPTNLYFLDGAGPTRALYRLAKTGGAATSLAVSGGFLAATSDGTSLYAADFSAGSTRLEQIPSGGGAPLTLETISYTRMLRADTDHLYFSDGALEVVGKSPNALPRVIAAGVRGPFVVDAFNAYWVESDCNPGSAAPCTDEGAVLSAPLGGGPTRTLCSGRMIPWNLALGGGALYVADEASGSILKLTP